MLVDPAGRRQGTAALRFITTFPPLLPGKNRTDSGGSMPLSRIGAARLFVLIAASQALAGCLFFSDNDPPAGEPSFYRSLAHANAQFDAKAAQAMISGYRRNNGLSAVTLDPALMRLAQEHARAMAASNRLDHNLGRSFPERLKSGGYDAKLAAENISAGYHTIAEAFSGWRDSSAHRANMLLSGATRMGIAAVYAPESKYKVFWTLILAAPDEDRKRLKPVARKPEA
jgi:uncharacterized protein YkwD